MDNLLPDDLIRELEGVAIRTTQGSFVRLEDARRLLEKKKEAEATPIPEHLKIHEARALARAHLTSEGMGAQGPQEPGRSIPATEPRPSSRT